MLSLRERWRRQDVVWGPSLKLRDPAVVEILGQAGFHSVVIDQEHATLNEESVEHLIRAALLADVMPVVRVPENRAPLISKALDMGAHGVVVPHVTSRTDAERAVRAAKFYPLGERGVDPTVRAGGYSFREPQEYYRHSNDHTAIIVQIEGASGVDNARAIAETPGLDAVFIGPYDLSQSLGIPGDVSNPLLRAKMKEIIRICAEAQVTVGTFAGNLTDFAYWFRAGIRYFWFSTDNIMLAAESRAVARQLQAAVESCTSEEIAANAKVKTNETA